MRGQRDEEEEERVLPWRWFSFDHSQNGLSVTTNTLPGLLNRQFKIVIASASAMAHLFCRSSRVWSMRQRATVALSTTLLALCVFISSPTSAVDYQSRCTNAADCTEEVPATLPRHPHQETMSNADKFIELANGEFPDGALPGQQEYEHPLVKR